MTSRSIPPLGLHNPTGGLPALAAGAFMLSASWSGALADDKPNACPIDGCEVTITGVSQAGDELELTYDANFTPDVSKNHIHAWWGEQYTIEQAGRSAEPVHGVTQAAGIAMTTTRPT